MKTNSILKKLTIILFLLISNYSFSQFYYFYRGNSENVITGFEYNNLHYDASPNGLKAFINDTKMSNKLKSDLSVQMKSIKTKRIVSDVAGWTLFATGGGIMINEALSKEDGEQMNSSKLLTGLGTAALGGIINWIIKPKKKDYYNFINTFNKEKNKEPIKIGFKIDYSKQLNYGLAITF